MYFYIAKTGFMKRRMVILLLIVLTSISTQAQYREKSVLEIRLNDHSPLVVSIDGRNYNKHGSNITIGNLPEGWHTLRVYKYMEYKQGGGRAKLLYTGRVRIDGGTVTRCIVDIQSQRMRIKTMDVVDAYVDYEAQQEKTDIDQNQNNADNYQNKNLLTRQDMADLKKNVEGTATDIDRVKLLKSVLEKKNYYSNQVREMLGWLAFESSKLEVAKWAYDRVLDKQDYWKLEDVFSFSSSKDEFNKYINGH